MSRFNIFILIVCSSYALNIMSMFPILPDPTKEGYLKHQTDSQRELYNDFMNQWSAYLSRKHAAFCYKSEQEKKEICVKFITKFFKRLKEQQNNEVQNCLVVMHFH